MPCVPGPRFDHGIGSQRENNGGRRPLVYSQYTDDHKRVDGQVFEVKIDVFDLESQKSIIENAPKPKAELLIQTSVGKRNKRQSGSSYMKDQTISASVKIENDSRNIDFSEGKGTLFLIARQTRRYSDRDSDYGKVLSKQTFNISVKASEERKFEAQPIVTSYDSDRDETNIGGWAYYGYLFILQDKDGEIHSVDCSIGNLKKDVESDPTLAKKILPLTKESLVEKNLEKL
ncbi:MAG: hypothetical protein P1U85_03600 [Verrucomicrobiales bacterium]|nr:hypothetical protein [Verrucomicrobiales bacterium]